MSFEIESDGDGEDFEESYSFDARSRKPRSSTSTSASTATKKTASFFGGAVKGDEDVYDFDFDEQGKSSKRKSNAPGTQKGSNESMNSTGGGGLRRSSTGIHQSITSDDLASKGSSENALEKAQRMLQKYNPAAGGERKAPVASRARRVEEFDENDISLDDSDDDDFANKRSKALPSNAYKSNNPSNHQLHDNKKTSSMPTSLSTGNTHTFQISRSQAMSGGDGDGETSLSCFTDCITGCITSSCVRPILVD